MSNLKWIAYGFIAIALLAICSVFVADMVGLVRSLEKDKVGDAATWFGAVFTGLAFVGTIVLALQKDNAKEQADLRKAYAVVASISLSC